MIKKPGPYKNVDEYIRLYPAAIRQGLELLRKTIKQAAPDAEETISYQMPAYKLNGMLVFFAKAKSHYGFYPTAGPMQEFAEKLKPYKTSKGAIQFPLDKPLPVKLIADIVKWKVKDNERTSLTKKKTTTKKPAK